MVYGVSSLADTFPQSSRWGKFDSGGCFAAMVGCFGRMLCRCVWLIGWILCHLCWVVDLCTLDIVASTCSLSCRVLAGVVGRALCHPCVALLLFWLCFLVCVHFFSISFFISLCSCVGQALLGCIKIVYVTAFFLMKNVLRHGCEKSLAFHLPAASFFYLFLSMIPTNSLF